MNAPSEEHTGESISVAEVVIAVQFDVSEALFNHNLFQETYTTFAQSDVCVANLAC